MSVRNENTQPKSCKFQFLFEGVLLLRSIAQEIASEKMLQRDREERQVYMYFGQGIHAVKHIAQLKLTVSHKDQIIQVNDTTDFNCQKIQDSRSIHKKFLLKYLTI